MPHPFAKVRLLNYFSYLFLVVFYCNRHHKHCSHKYCYSTSVPFSLLHRLLTFKSRSSLDSRNNKYHFAPSTGNAIGSLVLFDGFLSMMFYAYATMIFFLLNGTLHSLVQGICRSSFPLYKVHIVPFCFTNAVCD
jgi:hypothetical protein